MIGNLYFLQEGPNGCIKIGWTAGDPDNRRRAMQVGNSSDLTVIGFREAPADAETGWHVRFSHICKRSEWFYPTAELLAAIRLEMEAPLPAPESPSQFDAGGGDVLEWLNKNNVTMLEFAEGLGYGLAHVANCIEGSRNSISPRMAHRIEKFTNGELTAESFLAGPRAAAAARQKARNDWVAEQYAKAVRDQQAEQGRTTTAA